MTAVHGRATSVFLSSLVKCDFNSVVPSVTEPLKEIRDLIRSFVANKPLPHPFEYYAQATETLCKEGSAEKLAGVIFEALEEAIKANFTAEPLDGAPETARIIAFNATWHRLKRTLRTLAQVFVYMEMNHLKHTVKMELTSQKTIESFASKSFLRYPRVEVFGCLTFANMLTQDELCVDRLFLELTKICSVFPITETQRDSLKNLCELNEYHNLDLPQRLPETFSKAGRIFLTRELSTNRHRYMYLVVDAETAFFELMSRDSQLVFYTFPCVESFFRAVFLDRIDELADLVIEWIKTKDNQLSVAFTHAKTIAPSSLITLEGYAIRYAENATSDCLKRYQKNTELYPERHWVCAKVLEVMRELEKIAQACSYEGDGGQNFYERLKGVLTNVLIENSAFVHDALLKMFDVYAKGAVPDHFMKDVNEVLKLPFPKDQIIRSYTSQMSRRLLVSFGSPTLERERELVTALRDIFENDENWVSIERMIGEIHASKTEFAAFRKHQEEIANHVRPSADITISCIKPENWPRVQSSPQLNLPADIARELEAYSEFFESKNEHRSLTWAYSLHNVQMNFRIGSQVKQIVCPSYHAVTLLAFNDHTSLSFGQLATITCIEPPLLREVLNVLTHGKNMLLIQTGEEYRINEKFKEKARKITIKMTKPAKKPVETERQNEGDVIEMRDFIRVFVVRYLKIAKQCTHLELMEALRARLAECNRTLETLSDVKESIETLISQEYIARSGEAGYMYVV